MTGKKTFHTLFADALFQQTSVGVICTDADLTFIDVNPAVSSVFERDCRQYLGSPVFDLLHVLFDLQTVHSLIEKLRKLQDDRVPVRTQARFTKKDGSQQILDLSLCPVTDSPGEQGFLIMMEQARDCAPAEMVCEAPQPGFQTVIEHAMDAILLVDERGKYMDANAPACTLLGYRREELLALEVWDVISEQNLEAFREHWQEFVTYGHHEGEYLLQRKDGTLVAVEYRVTGHLVSGFHLVVMKDTSECKRLTGNLHKSEERFKIVSELTSDYAYAVRVREEDGGPVLVFEWVTEAFGQVSGFSTSELEALDGWKNLIYPEDLPIVLRHQHMYLEGKPDVAEFRVVTKSGDVRWLRDTGRSILDESSGRVVRIYGAAKDITENKRLEEKYRALIENSQDGILLLGSDGSIKYLSPSCRSILGYDAEEVTGQQLSKFLHPDDLDRLARLFGEAIQQPGVVATCEGRVRHKDGSWRWLEATGKSLLDDPSVQGFVVNYHDITHRKETEAMLQASEERYRRLVELSPDAVGILKEKQIVYLNSAGLHMIGATSPEDVIGLTLPEFVHPDDWEPLQQRFKIIQAGETLPRSELSIRRFDGNELVVESNGVQCLYEGEPAILFIARDITGRKQIEEQLRETTEKYRSFVEQVPAITYLCSLDEVSKTIYISPQVHTFLGFHPEEYTSVPDFWIDHVHPEDRERVYRELHASFPAGGNLSSEYRFFASDGRLVWLRDQAAQILDRDGIPQYLQGVMLDITEQKHVEQQLQETEAKYRALVEQIPAITYISSLDDSSTTLYISPQVQKLLGFPQEDWVSDPDIWNRHIHPDDRERVLEQLYASHSSGKDFSSEYRFLTRDGRVLWFHDHAAPVLDQDGKPQFLQGIMVDITEQKQMQDQLYETEAKFRTLVNNIPAVTYITALNDFRTLIYVSPQIEDLLGYSRAEWSVNPRLWIDRLHPEDLEHVLSAFASSTSSGSPISLEYRLLTKDNQTLWLHDDATVVYDDRDQALFYQGVVFDITEQKKAEETIKRSRDFYISLFDEFPVLVWRTDTAGECNYINKQWAEFTGQTSEQGLGQSWMEAIHPEDLETVNNIFFSAVKNCQRLEMEYRIHHRSGDYRWIRDIGKPYYNLDGSFAGYIGAGFDIHDQKLVEAEVLRKNSQLQVMADSSRVFAEASLEYSAVSSALHVIVKRCAELVGDTCVLALLSEDGRSLHPVSSYNPDPQLNAFLQVLLPSTPYSLEQGPAGQVILTGQAFLVPVVDQDQVRRTIHSGHLSYLEACGIHSILIVPLLVQGRAIGTLGLTRDRPGRPYNEEDQKFLQNIADRAAMAIQRVRFFEATQIYSQQLEALYSTTTEIIAAQDLPTLLHSIVERATLLLKAQGGELYLSDPQREELHCLVSYRTLFKASGRIIKYGEGPAGRAASSGKPQIVHTCWSWPLQERILGEDDALNNVLSVPLAWQGQVIGVLQVFVEQSEARFSQVDQEILALFANQAAIAVKNAQLLGSERQRSNELARSNNLIAALSQVAALLRSSLDRDEVMQILGEELKKIGVFYFVAVLDEEKDTLSIQYTSIDSEGLAIAERLAGKKIQGFRIHKQHFPYYEELIERQKGVFISDIEALTAKLLPGVPFAVIRQSLSMLGFNSSMKVIDMPLVIDQRVFGVIAMFGENLLEVDMPAYSVFASQITVAMENSRLFQKVRKGRERLQALSRRLVEVQEAERRQIARELHDEIGQILTGLKFLIRTGDNLPAEQHRNNLQEAQRLVNDLMLKVRELSLDLRPQMLDDLGLLPALLWLFNRFTNQTCVQVHFKHLGIEQKRFLPETETSLYRIVQESLTNIARHAGVKDVDVHLIADQDQITLRVKDSGVGFDPKTVMASRYTGGLVGMRERAMLSGGDFEVKSASGMGTEIAVIFPVDGKRKVERRKGVRNHLHRR